MINSKDIQLIRLLKEHANISCDDEQTLLATDFQGLGIDSLSVFSFISEVESTFNVTISDDDLPSLNSIRKISEYINN
tara:strand:- start:202 stop:435 length:234 start_codon:yes stop_codon:yes gene_type:complete